MRGLGFEEIRFDRMGNILGRMGGDRSWSFMIATLTRLELEMQRPGMDPFHGKVEEGTLYGCGACDEKGSTPGMIYGLAIAKNLGLLEGVTMYYFGNMEENCDGIASHALVEMKVSDPVMS